MEYYNNDALPRSLPTCMYMYTVHDNYYNNKYMT